MSNANTGGPAFPTENAHQSGHTTWHHEGMTLRDYFIAHAPAEPQSWFKPAMDTARPVRPARPHDLTEAEKEDLAGWGEYLYAEDLENPRSKEYALACEKADKSGIEWDKVYTKQKYVQWPAAWADEMLSARAP